LAGALSLTLLVLSSRLIRREKMLPWSGVLSQYNADLFEANLAITLKSWVNQSFRSHRPEENRECK
jgi:hypothetical protein